jgi:hypothetical protein
MKSFFVLFVFVDGAFDRVKSYRLPAAAVAAGKKAGRFCVREYRGGGSRWHTAPDDVGAMVWLDGPDGLRVRSGAIGDTV